MSRSTPARALEKMRVEAQSQTRVRAHVGARTLQPFLARGLWTALVLTLSACLTPPMLWDAGETEIEAALVRRLGDPAAAEEALAGLRYLLPYPMPTDAGLDLVVCRFAGQRPEVSVQIDLEGTDREEAKAVLTAARGLSAVQWKMADAESGSPGRARIRIRQGGARTAASPAGQASTRARCALPVSGASSEPVRPELVSAEIDIWRSGENAGGKRVEISAEAWAGALLHELGHALGFQGHVRRQRSWLSLDQTHLRRFGRAVRAGRSLEAPVLEGLYSLASGTVLGRRTLTPSTRAWRRRILAEVGAVKGLAEPVRLEALVGDRSAEWAWVMPDGRRLALRFPYWRDQLSGQGPVLGVPTASTRRLLEAATPIQE